MSLASYGDKPLNLVNQNRPFTFFLFFFFSFYLGMQVMGEEEEENTLEVRETAHTLKVQKQR